MAAEKKPNLTLNLNKEIKNTIHRPKVNDTILYVPTESNAGEGIESGVNRDELIKLGRQAQSYNSPTNIRKVWLTLGGVRVEYYKSPIVKGKADGLEHKYAFNRTDKILSYPMEVLSRYVIQPDNPRNPVESMTFKGNILSFLQYPWVLSNIEEIYMEFPYMLTLENLEYLAAMLNDSVLGRKTVGFIYTLLGCEDSVQTQTGFYKSDIPAAMVYSSCGMRNGDIKSLRAKFPRLKYVGVIFKSSKKLFPDTRCAKDNIAHMPDNPNGYWLPYAAQGLKTSSLSFISTFENVDDVYRARPGIYKFDDEILLPYFEKLREQKITDAAEASKKRAEERKKFEAPTNCLEADLDAMYLMHKEDESKIITRLLFGGMSKATITKIFSEFTDEAQKRYSDMLGITLRR